MKTDTRRRIVDAVMWNVGIATFIAVVADAAASDRRLATTSNDRWRNECGSCHVPYPPQLLGAPSWRAIMGGLDRHFGSDASVDAAAAKEIGAFLERSAGPDRRASDGRLALRVTETAWFVREHGEHGALRSSARPSDCAACHRGAADGDFGERTLRVPGAS